MPTAELLKPRTLNYLGRIWERGVAQSVDVKTGFLLDNNPRFKVKGLPETMPEEVVDDEVDDTEDVEALTVDMLRDAIDALDLDDETAFTATGKPNPHALAAILGVPVTMADVDEALKVSRPPETEDDIPEVKPAGKAATRAPKAKGKAGKGGVTIKRVPRSEAEKVIAAKAQQENEADKADETDQKSGANDAEDEGEEV